MPHFMLDREILIPPGYAERSCLLVRYRLPLLRHCFVLCSESTSEETAASRRELLGFFLSEAERIAYESVGDSQAFILIYSGSSIRKRPSWHLHVFVVQHRWQKAWVYTVLSGKNTALACYNGVRRLFAGRRPNSSVERAP